MTEGVIAAEAKNMLRDARGRESCRCAPEYAREMLRVTRARPPPSKAVYGLFLIQPREMRRS